jgi:hypothetical protein
MAYATVTQLQGYAGIEDDRHNGLLALLIERATATMDERIGFSFEAASDTNRSLDAAEWPAGAVLGYTLYLGAWCASITTVTNGDGTVITSSYYVTEPRNSGPFYAIKLLGSSGYAWEGDGSGDTENAITVAGRWAYSTTAPADITHATLRLALWYYRQRDSSTDMDRPLLAEGVTIMPSQMPKDVVEILDRYRRRGT